MTGRHTTDPTRASHRRGAAPHTGGSLEESTQDTRPLPRLSPWRLRIMGLRKRINARRLNACPGIFVGSALVLLAAAAAVLLDPASTAPTAQPEPGTTTGEISTRPVPGPTVLSPPSAPIAAVEDPAGIPPRPVPPRDLSRLPEAQVGTAVPAAPADPESSLDPGISVLHPTREAVVYSQPGGPAIARLPTTQLGAATWVPVIAGRPGWAMTLLPSLPHPSGVAAAGWIHLSPHVELAERTQRILIDHSVHTVMVVAEISRATTSGSHGDAGSVSGGRPRSFVAIGRDTGAHWVANLLLSVLVSGRRICTGTPLAAISIPGWPADSPLGPLDPTGCLPVPPALHHALDQLPAGTPVLQN